MADLQTIVEVVAKAKSHHRLCARCHKPVKPNSDQVRGCRWTTSLLWHWKCWLYFISEHDQATAREISKEMNVS